jgi:hypothetical protein
LFCKLTRFNTNGPSIAKIEGFGNYFHINLVIMFYIIGLQPAFENLAKPIFKNTKKGNQ